MIATPGPFQPRESDWPQPLSQAEHRRLRRAARLRSARGAYLFLAPNLLFFSVFLLLPCAWAVYQSFRAGGVLAPSEFVGLQNWTGLRSDALVRTAIKNTALYAVMAIPAVFALGMGLALLLQHVRRGGAVARAFLYFPNLVPVVVGALAWLFAVHPDFGVLNLLLRAVGIGSVNWLGDTNLALPSIAMFEVWRGAGFWALLFFAALAGFPRELYQAAGLDGAGVFRRFRHVTLPLLRPTLLFALVMATIWNLQLFDSVYILTNGGPANATTTAVWYIFKSLFSFGNLGFASALSCTLLLLILGMTFVEFRLLRGQSNV